MLAEGSAKSEGELCFRRTSCNAIRYASACSILNRSVSAIHRRFDKKMTQPFFIAEVMDKEPTLLAIWTCALLLAGLGGAAASLRWWASLLIAACAAILSVGMLLEIDDPFVGSAIGSEAGSNYIFQVFIASVGAVGTPLIAAVIARRNSSAGR